MSLTPQNLIDDAIVLAYPYVREETLATVPLLRQLTQLDKEVASIFAIDAPERLSATGSAIPIISASNATGYALTAAKVYTTFTYADQSGNTWPVTLLDEDEFDVPKVSPSGIVRGVTFYPADPFGRRWADGDDRDFWNTGASLLYRYIAEPSRVTTMSQTLVSPDEAQPYLQWAVVLAVLLQAKGVPQEKLAWAGGQMSTAKQSLQLMAHKRAGN